MGERAGEGRYEFGILFVGGIEHQRPGKTTTQRAVLSSMLTAAHAARIC